MLAINFGGPGEWNSTGNDDLGAFLCNANTLPGSLLGIGSSFAVPGLTYSGNIANAFIGLVKLDYNTLILSGNNVYGVGTTVNAGILEAKYPRSLPGYNTTGAVTVTAAPCWRLAWVATTSGTHTTTTFAPC